MCKRKTQREGERQKERGKKRLENKKIVGDSGAKKGCAREIDIKREGNGEMKKICETSSYKLTELRTVYRVRKDASAA